MRSATVLMQAGAQMVKLEGGGWTAETVRFLVERGVPVCAHLGPHAADRCMRSAATASRASGDDAAATLSAPREGTVGRRAPPCWCSNSSPPSPRARSPKNVSMATIGIGGGPECSGQVLVLQDMLGIAQGKLPRFVRNFMEGAPSIAEAVATYVADVQARRFPDNTLHAY